MICSIKLLPPFQRQSCTGISAFRMQIMHWIIDISICKGIRYFCLQNIPRAKGIKRTMWFKIIDRICSWIPKWNTSCWSLLFSASNVINGNSFIINPLVVLGLTKQQWENKAQFYCGTWRSSPVVCKVMYFFLYTYSSLKIRGF